MHPHQGRYGRVHLCKGQRAVETARDDAAPIEDDGRRQAERGVRASVSLAAVDPDRKADPQRIGEGTRALRRLALVHADNCDPAARVVRFKALQIRHLGPARRTPGSPQIHQDDTTAILVERYGDAAIVAQRKDRRRFTDEALRTAGARRR